MTSSAPSERTNSTFEVLHTAVTTPPSALAIWRARWPTPPAAPRISTFVPPWNPAHVTHRLQRGAPGHGKRRRLLEREVHRLGGAVAFRQACVLRERAGAADVRVSEHL